MLGCGMEIRTGCSACHGTGKIVTNNPYESRIEIACSHCNEIGYTVTTISAPEFDVLTATLDDLKTKINHIKDKVNDIWDKVK